MFEPIVFSVEGKPVTQGSKQPFVPTYKSGNVVRRHISSCPGRTTHGPYMDAHGADLCRCPVMSNVVEDNDAHLKVWREAVGWAARQVYKGPLIDCLLVVQFEFVKPRPKNHYGTGRNAVLLKDSAPAAPGVKPDALKLARAIEDALTNVVYTDDSLIVTELIAKRYCDRLEPERVNIVIRPAECQTVGDLVAAGLLDLPRPETEFEQLDLLSA